jgi:exoribonuclease-2
MKPKLASIVAFYQARHLVLGLITEAAESRYRVHNESGDCGWFNAARFVLVGDGSYALDDIPASLQQFEKAMAAEMDIVSRLDYSFLEDAMLLQDIAFRLQLNGDSAVFALYLYLKDHPERFSHKKELFRLKSAEERQAYIAVNQLEQEREAYLNQVRRYLAGNEMDANAMDRLYTELPEIISDKKHRDLQRIFRDAYGDISTDEAVHRLRLKCGELSANIDPAIAKSGIPVGFSALLQGVKLLPAAPGAGVVTAFCIDDEDTRDYDDAISLEPCDAGWKLGIHVSAAAARIALGGNLFEEALRRASSLYATNAVIPLLPPVFSEQELSLIAGENRAVVSLYLTLDEGFTITAREFKPETIRILRNYSYKEVDKAIANEPFIQLLRISNKLKEARQSSHSAGKQRFYYFFKEIKGILQLRRIDNDSPARLIVEELMIEFNSSFAAFAQERNCPMIYRNITRFGNLEDENSASQAYLSTQAEFHPGIGAKAYLHASSPIRRVTDLINQYQMIALLNSTTLPFDAPKLEDAIATIEKRLLLLREVGHRSQRYWLLKYLEQECLHVPLDACLRGEAQGKLRVEIIPWGMQVMALCDTYPCSETFKLIVYEIDWEDWSVKADII